MRRRGARVRARPRARTRSPARGARAAKATRAGISSSRSSTYGDAKSIAGKIGEIHQAACTGVAAVARDGARLLRRSRRCRAPPPAISRARVRGDGAVRVLDEVRGREHRHESRQRHRRIGLERREQLGGRERQRRLGNARGEIFAQHVDVERDVAAALASIDERKLVDAREVALRVRERALAVSARAGGRRRRRRRSIQRRIASRAAGRPRSTAR